VLIRIPRYGAPALLDTRSVSAGDMIASTCRNEMPTSQGLISRPDHSRKPRDQHHQKKISGAMSRVSTDL
jgi:hypothetical protein